MPDVLLPHMSYLAMSQNKIVSQARINEVVAPADLIRASYAKMLQAEVELDPTQILRRLTINTSGLSIILPTTPLYLALIYGRIDLAQFFLANSSAVEITDILDDLVLEPEGSQGNEGNGS